MVKNSKFFNNDGFFLDFVDYEPKLDYDIIVKMLSIEDR